MADKLKPKDIERFKFYKTPPKKFYDKDPEDKYFNEDYAFILDSGDSDELSTGKIITSPGKSGLVVTANPLDSHEKPSDSYDFNYLDSHIRHNYFFKVKQDEVPSEVRKAILISLFDNKDPLRTRIKEL